MSDQILMGQPLLWVVLNFQNVAHHLGFKPVSDSDTEVAGFDAFGHTSAMMDDDTDFIITATVREADPECRCPLFTTVKLLSSAPQFICRDQISGGNRALSVGRKEKFSKA